MKRILTAGSIILPMLIVAAGLLTVCDSGQQSGQAIEYKLDNGMQVVLKANHASPMIASLIFVNSGSKYESKFDNGVTHFLEHLLFDGTAIETQEDISKGIERLGGYINAFTRKEFTAYLVLMPKENIDYGMAVQADMLFNSIFPEEQFPKERNIVIEEFKQDADAESAPAENFFEAKAYAGTQYSQPVIGYESIIANIPREAVIDYYKRFYAPNNMTALIIGDFEPDEMKSSLQKIFGQFASVDLPPAPESDKKPIEGKHVYKTSSDAKSTYIKYSIDAPQFNDVRYPAFMILEDYLSDEENSPLVKALKHGTEPLATSISASLDTKQEFTRLNIDIITEKPEMVDPIIELTDYTLSGLSTSPPSKKLLNGYKVTRRCDEIYMSEKLHYYGFVKAPLMVITGWDFFENLQTKIDSVKVADITTACQDFLGHLNYIATVTYQKGSYKGREDIPVGPSDKEVQAYFAEQKFPEHDLTSGKNFILPEIDHTIKTEQRYSEYLKEVLSNGITVIIKSNPDSRVFAMNIIGKNRSAMELPGKDGITDFVNRLIEKGTENYTAVQLSQELASIGAKITLYDNPWIPFDDRYTTRQYSFMKFETIDDFQPRGIQLFSEMLARPRFDSVDVEQVRSELFGLLGRDGGSTYKTASDDFYETMFKGGPYAKKIDGTFRTIGSITRADLREHHRRIYAPENIIITVGTRQHPAGVMALLKKELLNIPATNHQPVEIPEPAKIEGIETTNASMDKEQVYIYLGNLLPSASSPDAFALKVAAAVLSNRLHDVIREKHGLAYRVGASVDLDKNFGWYICSMGTGAENFKKAKKSILAEIDRLKTEPPDEPELEMAINSLWGSYLTANLSRINQLFYMGVYEYLGLGYGWGDDYIKGIRSVTAEQVSDVATKYFDTKNYLISTAGNI